MGERGNWKNPQTGRRVSGTFGTRHGPGPHCCRHVHRAGCSGDAGSNPQRISRQAGQMDGGDLKLDRRPDFDYSWFLRNSSSPTWNCIGNRSVIFGSGRTTEPRSSAGGCARDHPSGNSIRQRRGRESISGFWFERTRRHTGIGGWLAEQPWPGCGLAAGSRSGPRENRSGSRTTDRR